MLGGGDSLIEWREARRLGPCWRRKACRSSRRRRCGSGLLDYRRSSERLPNRSWSRSWKTSRRRRSGTSRTSCLARSSSGTRLLCRPRRTRCRWSLWILLRLLLVRQRAATRSRHHRGGRRCPRSRRVPWNWTTCSSLRAPRSRRRTKYVCVYPLRKGVLVDTHYAH